MPTSPGSRGSNGRTSRVRVSYSRIAIARTLTEGRDRERGGALAAADEAHPLAGRRLHVDRAEDGGQRGVDRVVVRGELRPLEHHGRVDVQQRVAAGAHAR